MALCAASRGPVSRLLMGLRPCTQAASAQLQQAGLHTTHSSSSNSSEAQQQASPGTDPFTLSLQSKTEQEVFSLLEKAKQQQQDDEEEDDDLVDVVNSETGVWRSLPCCCDRICVWCLQQVCAHEEGVAAALPLLNAHTCIWCVHVAALR